MNIPKTARVLHLAPERGIFDRLRAHLAGDNYVVADFLPKRYPFVKDMVRVDLAQLDDWKSADFDLILHSHVLEHVPCNLAYVFFHLHRMLKPDGKHVCILPFMAGTYEECFDDIGDAQRTARFGQFDHVRRIGRRGVDQHVGKIVRMPPYFDATAKFGDALLTRHNIPEVDRKGLQRSTVLTFAKDDYLLK